MEDEREKRGGPGAILFGIGMMLLTPMLYVLSIGPAAWLAKNYPPAEDWLIPIYYPLVIVGEACPPVQESLKSYMSLWGG